MLPTRDMRIDASKVTPTHDMDGLYRAIGRKIRAARERSTPRLSQDKLAKRLRISRASIVNIEAGRQHAPVSLLWKIARVLNVELTALIPQQAELLEREDSVQLKEKMRKQIELEANGNPKMRKSLTTIVSRLLASIGTDENRGKS